MQSCKIEPDRKEHTELRTLIVFNQVTVYGYFTVPNGDLSWSHGNKDEEWKTFVENNAKSGGVLLFGRITYEMMASYWPTPQAMRDDPVVAERMQNLPKVVFSNSLRITAMANTKVVRNDLAGEVRKMKNEEGQQLVVMGSGSIVRQLTCEHLVDEYQLVIHPVVLGKGRSLFEGQQLPLQLAK